MSYGFRKRNEMIFSPWPEHVSASIQGPLKCSQVRYVQEELPICNRVSLRSVEVLD